MLAWASDADESTLVRGLVELWRRRIIHEQGPDAYDFSYDKLREVAYTSLSAARRRILHDQIRTYGLLGIAYQRQAEYLLARQAADAAPRLIVQWIGEPGC
jgi:hypothetical protein